MDGFGGKHDMMKAFEVDMAHEWEAAGKDPSNMTVLLS